MNASKLVRMVAAGEYSDYTIWGLLLVECEDGAAWLRERVDEWTAAHPDQREPYTGSFTEFYAWLETRPGVSLVEFEEWHIGSYGTFEPKVERNEPRE